MARVLLVVLAAFAMACGRVNFDAAGDAATVVNADVPEFQAGARLRPFVADFGGGARELRDWFDLELDSICVAHIATDGMRRCIPPATSLSFLDAACTTGVALWDEASSPTPPRWAYEIDSSGCELVYQLFTLGAELAPQMYYRRTGASCNGPFALPATSRLLAVVAEEPPATFARLDPVRIGTGRLQASGWLSEDGARDLREVHDRELDVSCEVSESDGRCTPSGRLVQSNLFADAACSVGLAGIDGCENNTYVRTIDACGQLTRTSERGAPWTGPVYSRSGQTCAEAVRPFDVTLVGAEVDRATLADGQFYDDDAHTGRVVGRGWLANDGTRVRVGWRNTDRGGEHCSLAAGTDLGIRCLPAATLAFDYRDSACLVPIADAATTCSRSYLAAGDSRGVTFHAIEPAASMPAARFVFIGSCTQQTFDSTLTYDVGGPVLPFEDFPFGTLVRD